MFLAGGERRRSLGVEQRDDRRQRYQSLQRREGKDAEKKEQDKHRRRRRSFPLPEREGNACGEPLNQAGRRFQSEASSTSPVALSPEGGATSVDNDSPFPAWISIHGKRAAYSGVSGGEGQASSMPLIPPTDAAALQGSKQSTVSTRFLPTRTMSGLGMEDPVGGHGNDRAKRRRARTGGTNSSEASSPAPAPAPPNFVDHPSMIFEDMSLGAVPLDMRDMVTVASDPTANTANRGIDARRFAQCLPNFDPETFSAAPPVPVFVSRRSSDNYRLQNHRKRHSRRENCSLLDNSMPSTTRVSLDRHLRLERQLTAGSTDMVSLSVEDLQRFRRSDLQQRRGQAKSYSSASVRPPISPTSRGSLGTSASQSPRPQVRNRSEVSSISSLSFRNATSTAASPQSHSLGERHQHHRKPKHQHHRHSSLSSSLPSVLTGDSMAAMTLATATTTRTSVSSPSSINTNRVVAQAALALLREGREEKERKVAESHSTTQEPPSPQHSPRPHHASPVVSRQLIEGALAAVAASASPLSAPPFYSREESDSERSVQSLLQHQLFMGPEAPTASGWTSKRTAEALTSSPASTMTRLRAHESDSYLNILGVGRRHAKQRHRHRRLSHSPSQQLSSPGGMHGSHYSYSSLVSPRFGYYSSSSLLDDHASIQEHRQRLLRSLVRSAGPLPIQERDNDGGSSPRTSCASDDGMQATDPNRSAVAQPKADGVLLPSPKQSLVSGNDAPEDPQSADLLPDGENEHGLDTVADDDDDDLSDLILLRVREDDEAPSTGRIPEGDDDGLSDAYSSGESVEVIVVVVNEDSDELEENGCDEVEPDLDDDDGWDTLAAKAGISTQSRASTAESMATIQVRQLREEVIARYVSQVQNSSISSRSWNKKMNWVLSTPTPTPDRGAQLSSPQSPYPTIVVSSPTVGSNLVAGLDRLTSSSPPGKRANTPRTTSAGDSPVSVRSSFQYPEAHPVSPTTQAKPRAIAPVPPTRTPYSKSPPPLLPRQTRSGVQQSAVPSVIGDGTPSSPSSSKAASASLPVSPTSSAQRSHRHFSLVEHLVQVAVDSDLDAPKRTLPVSVASLFPEG